MADRRKNKTARVLNLIAQPGEKPEGAEPSQPQPAAPVHEEQAAAQPAADTSAADTPAAGEEQAASPEAAAPAPAAEKVQAESPAEDTPPLAAPPVKKAHSKAKATHVTPEEQAEPVEQPPAAREQQPLPPVPQPTVPIVQTAREKEHALSEEIRSGLELALEQALEAEEKTTEHDAAGHAAVEQVPQTESAPAEPVQAEPSAAAAPAQAEPPAVAAAPAQAEPPAVAAAPAPAASPAVEESEAADKHAGIRMPEPQVPQEQVVVPHGERDVKYVNVLQELVEETAPYYIAQMMRCNCPRCVADMKALALTSLPSKYVVLNPVQKNAYMSIYAARYDKDLSVQMMRACVMVNDNPHH